MIAISSGLASTAGHLVFDEDPGSKLSDLTARVSRTGTLDGGCAITHSGFADGDRTLTIEATGMRQLTEAEAAIVNTLFSTLTRQYIACEAGHFYGAIESAKFRNGDLRLSFLVEEKLSS